MNCSAACAYTLPATQPSSTWQIAVQSAGASTATVVLGGSDTYNGSTSVPLLNAFAALPIWANTAISTDYRGGAPLVASTGMTFTPASNGLSLSSTGGSGTAVDILSDQKASGTPFYQTNEYLAVSASQVVTLLSKTGAGYVSSIFLALGSNNYQAAILNVYVNGDSSPAISGPVRDYFEDAWVGSGFFGNKLFSFNFASGLSSTLAIPFNNGITITLTTNASDTIWTNVIGQTISDSWPNTEKLLTNIIDSPTPGSVNGVTYSPYSYETLANYAGSNPGRLVGVFILDDSTSASVAHASLEGNVAIYTDVFNSTWAALTTFSLGQIIMDPCGNFQTVTTAGTTGSTEPTCSSWANVSTHTTTDGSVTWTASVGTPLNIWRASKSYASLGMSFIDQNGNVETVTTTGTSAATEPTYPTGASCPGATTTDGTVVETCSLASTMVKAAFVSTGTEDFFNLGFYAANAGTNSQGNGGTNGVNFNSSSRLGMYRFFINDPIRFGHSVGIIRQIGDSTEVPFTGSTLQMACTYLYTQDTN